MRSVHGTVRRRLLRQVLVIAASLWMVGVSYGALSTQAGLPVWVVLLMAVVVLAGSSEFVFVGVLAAGGLPLVGALAGLAVNLRVFAYGLTAGRWFDGRCDIILGAHLTNDESIALAAAQPDRRTARIAFFLCGIGVLLSWPLGALCGALLGGLVDDPAVLGLDAALPALLAALVLPALRDGDVRLAAAVGAVIALAATPWLPVGIPVILAPLGVLAALAVRRWRPRPADPLAEEAVPLDAGEANPATTATTEVCR